MSIFWLLFWKGLIIGLWEVYSESKKDGDWDRLVSLFKQKWDRRLAEQPPALTYQPRGPGAG